MCSHGTGAQRNVVMFVTEGKKLGPPPPPHAGERSPQAGGGVACDLAGCRCRYFSSVLSPSLALKTHYCYTKNCYIFYFKTKIAIKLLFSVCVHKHKCKNERETKEKIQGS